MTFFEKILCWLLRSRWGQRATMRRYGFAIFRAAEDIPAGSMVYIDSDNRIRSRGVLN